MFRVNFIGTLPAADLQTQRRQDGSDEKTSGRKTRQRRKNFGLKQQATGAANCVPTWNGKMFCG
jgi:hypothetical protein